MIVDTVTARAEPKKVVNLKAVRPALDLVDGTMILSAPRQVVELGNQAPQWENTVITSKRERFPLCAEDLANRGWFAKDLDKIDVRVAEERYSRHVIEGFLQGNLSGDLADAYHGIKDTIGLYLDFTDARTYDYLTCWIIGTYFYNIFSHYPYVHFTGPKGTGKSQCLHVLERLCHNAKMAGSMSLAVQFRLIEALQPTILFDEMENLGQTQHTELHRMLKYGFEKNGPQVWRMDTSDKKDLRCELGASTAHVRSPLLREWKMSSVLDQSKSSWNALSTTRSRVAPSNLTSPFGKNSVINSSWLHCGRRGSNQGYL